MKGILHLVFVMFFFITSSFSAHRYYVSITKMEIDEKEKLLKIHTQLFANDLEKTLQKRYDISSMDFTKLKDEEKQILKEYISRKLQIKINRTALDLTYLGCEIEGELLFIYIEGKLDNEVKRLDIENTMLQDQFSEQQNNIDVSHKNKTQSLRLNSEVPKGTLFF